MKKILLVVIFVLIISMIIVILSIPYKYYYNKGNKLYNANDYNEAINMYKKSLKFLPPKYKECSIRINLALSVLKEIDKYDDIYQNKDKILKILDEAEDIICEKGCADKNGINGHSKKAQELEEDINKMRDKLKDKSENDPQEPQEPKEKNKNKTGDSKKEEIKNIQNKSYTERMMELDKSSWSKDYSYYDGKKW